MDMLAWVKGKWVDVRGNESNQRCTADLFFLKYDGWKISVMKEKQANLVSMNSRKRRLEYSERDRIV
jgi:hypothetical protein